MIPAEDAPHHFGRGGPQTGRLGIASIYTAFTGEWQGAGRGGPHTKGEGPRPLISGERP